MSNASNRRYAVDSGWEALCKDLEISSQDVLRHAGLPLDLMSQKMPTITGAEYFRLWDGIEFVLRDMPAFPLHLAQAKTVEMFSPPVFACLCSDNMNVALKRIAKYKPIVGPCRMFIEQSAEFTSVSFKGVHADTPLPPSFIAFELTFWVHVVRLATREHIVPAGVHIAVELPEQAAYEAFFGTRVQRDDFNGLTFSAEDAQKPFLSPSSSMWSIFEPELQRRMADLTQESPFKDRVRACLIEVLASGQHSITDVAAKLAVSSRTLQRRLRQENTSFQKVLDELRAELAYHYLSDSDYTTGQIAFLLGYEETSSFYRAFRVWTDQTPELVRASNRRM